MMDREMCDGCPYFIEYDNDEIHCDIWSSDDDDCPLLYTDCPNCGKHVLKVDMQFTYDCHGIPYRHVCLDCWDKLMAKGYDGEYYTEADECIDWDY